MIISITSLFVKKKVFNEKKFKIECDQGTPSFKFIFPVVYFYDTILFKWLAYTTSIISFTIANDGEQ